MDPSGPADDDDGLPPPGTSRWTASRKAAVVEAVRDGRLDAAEARRRYWLSGEELAAWEGAVERHGAAGLKVGHLRVTRRRARPGAS